MDTGATDQKPNLTKLLTLVVSFATWLFSTAVLANVTIAPSDDCLACNGVVVVTATIPGNLTYEWYSLDGNLVNVEISDAGSSELSGLCPGVYRVQYTNGSENNSIWFSVGVPGNDAGEVVHISPCTGSGNNNLYNRLEGEPTPGGTWTSPTGLPHNGIFNPNSGLPGFYTYTVEVDGCSLQSGVMVTIVQNADPGLSTTYLICETYDPFFLTDVLAGTPDYGGQWFNSQQVAIDGFYYPETDDTQLFTYMIDTVAGCPPVFSTMFVIENQLPNPGEDSEIAVCPNAIPFNMTQMLEGNPDLNGTWVNNINAPVGNTFDPDLLPAGTYTYIVQAATPCPSQEAQLTIAFTDGISAGLPTPLDLCTSDSEFDLFDSLSGQVSDGGVWSDPQGNEVENVLSPDQALSGGYTYLVEAVGCQPVSSTVEVTVEQELNAGIGGILNVCENSSPIVLSTLLNDNATAGGTWTIDGDEIVGSLVIEGGQTYSLQYALQGTICPSVSENYQVVIDEVPVINGPISSEFCGSTGTLELASIISSSGGFEAIWYDTNGLEFAGEVPLTENYSGNYSYTFLSGNMCPNAEGSIDLLIENPPFEEGSYTESVCYSGAPFNLFEFDVDLPVGGEWTFNGQPINPNVSANSLSSGVYQYAMNGGSICGTTALEIELDVVIPPSAGEGATLTVCTTANPFEPQALLTDASPGGDWLFNGEPVVNPTFDPGQGDGGVYTYVIPAFGPCEGDSSVIEVYVDQGFAFSAGEDVEVCTGSPAIALGMDACDECTYEWTPITGLSNTSVSSPTFQVPSLTSSESFVIDITVSNGICELSDQVLITVHPLPVLSVDGPTSVCFNDEGVWTVNGADDYLWQTSSGSIQEGGTTFATSIHDDTSIEVIGTNAFGCSSSIFAEVEMLTIPLVMADIPPSGGCAPHQFFAELPQPEEDGTELYWMIDGVEYFGDAAITFETPGVYDITLIGLGENGCEAAFTVDQAVDVYPTPVAWFDFNLSDVSVFRPIVQFENFTSGAHLWQWTFGNYGESVLHSPEFAFPPIADQGHRICLEATNAFGCTDVVCRDLFIPGELVIYVPNAFTPDNDGINEVFQPVVSGFVEGSYQLEIYNRWGEQVFATNDPSEPWRGNVDRGAYYAQTDTYVWVIKARDQYSAESKRIEGHVVVIR